MKLEDILTFEEDDDMEKTIDFEAMTEEINICIENPWAGDSISGFGAQACIDLDFSQVLQLRAYLDEWIKTRKQ